VAGGHDIGSGTADLLALYPRPYRERFAESMEQTFTDLCRERAAAEGRAFGAFVLCISSKRSRASSASVRQTLRGFSVVAAAVAAILQGASDRHRRKTARDG
jgi:hypothetical protein